MNDRLEKLIRHADADMPTARPRDVEPFVTDIVHAAAVRTRRRQRAIAASVVGLLLLGVYLARENTPTKEKYLADRLPRVVEEREPARSVDSLRAEIDRLDRAADLAMLVVARLQERERSGRTTRFVAAKHSTIEAEFAAQTMLIRGDRLAGEDLTQRLAPDAYRRIIELFPQSAAAEAAIERLARLDEAKGDRV